MFLEILLSALIICIISGGVLVYLWWRKYGKKIFGLLDTVNSIKGKGIPQIPKIDSNNNMDNLKNSLNSLNDLMGSLQNINKNINPPKR